jgi:hypothetical protein
MGLSKGAKVHYGASLFLGASTKVRSTVNKAIAESKTAPTLAKQIQGESIYQGLRHLFSYQLTILIDMSFDLRQQLIDDDGGFDDFSFDDVVAFGLPPPGEEGISMSHAGKADEKEFEDIIRR